MLKDKIDKSGKDVLSEPEGDRVITCHDCSEVMRKMDREEVKELNLEHAYPRGVYKCIQCGCMVTLEPIPAEGGWVNKIQPRVI